MLRLVVIVAVLAASCSDCSNDADPWNFDELEETEDVEEGDVREGNNGVVAPDMGDKPDVRPPLDTSKPTCVEASTPSFFELLTPDFVHSPTVANERVFAVGSRGDEPNSLYEWTPDGMQLVEGGVDTVLGASDQAIWVGTAEEVRQLTLDGDLVATAPEGVFRYGGLGWFSQVRPNAVGDRIAWVQDSYLRTLDGGTYEEPASDAVLSLPWVTDDVLAHEFLSDEGLHGVRVYGERDWEFIGPRNAGWPVATASQLFFINGGELWVRTLSGSDAEPVLPGVACGPPFATGDGLVVGCNSTIDPGSDRLGGRPDYLTGHFTELWTVDPDTLEATQVHTADEAGIFNPVVNERWILWYEFDRSSDGINPFVQGPIYALPRGNTSSAPVAVGTIGIGCPTCGAYWPPPRMVLDGDTVAWNYAIDGDEPPEVAPRNTYAVAKLSACDL